VRLPRGLGGEELAGLLGRYGYQVIRQAGSHLRRRWPLLVVGVLFVLYIAYFGWYTLSANDRYQSGGFDLAIFSQVSWNTAHGNWYRSTYKPGWDIYLADHVAPILLPISLFYLLWPSPKTLLLLQTIILALGALPVYWLARDALQAALHGRSSPGQETRDRPSSPASTLLIQLSALAFACIYLLYPPLHSANVYEFHPSALATSLLLYALYFMRQRRTVLFFIFILLTMITKEVLPLTTLAVGLYILIIRREWLVGTTTIVVSVVWFILATFVIIPHFNPEGQSSFFSSSYGWLGDSGSEILVRLITHPGLILQRLISHTGPAYLAGLLGPLAYFPLLGLPILLLATPALILNALSDAPPQHFLGNYFHYAAAIVPFVIVGAIDGASFLTRHLGRFASRILPAKIRLAEPRPFVAILVSGIILITSIVAQRQHGYLPFSRDFYLAAKSERVAAIKAIVQQVPPLSSVSTVVHPAPDLSLRENLYSYPDQPDADYLVIDVSYRDWPIFARDRYDSVQQLVSTGQYGVRDGRYGHLLLERGLDQPTIPDRFYDFVKADNPSPQFRMEVDFGDELRLIGFDLVWERPLLARAYLVLYWQVLCPTDRDLRFFFLQTDPSGEPLPGTEMEFVAPVWYPPSRWPTSEVIRTQTLRWNLEEQRQFGVAVGVVEGAGVWDLDKRLRPVVRSAPWELRLVHGDGLLWLATLNTDGQFVTLERPGEHLPHP